MKNDNQFEYKTRHGDVEQVKITLDIYAHYDNLYLGMDYYDAELGGMVPYTDVTVNTIKMPYLYAAIDTNNNGEEIVSFLEENGFGENTGKVVSSGWCVYPIFQFNEEALQRIAPYEFREYQKAHGIEPPEIPRSANNPTKETFYFSFGTSKGFPFRLGHVAVRAENREQACELFRSHYPDRHKGVLNCAFVYSESEWRETTMAKDEPGQVCHQTIDSWGPHREGIQSEPIENAMETAKDRAAEKNADRPGKTKEAEHEI